MGALEMVQEQYPHLAWLLGDPEIGPLLVQAVTPGTEIDATTLDTKIKQTNWFRSRTEEGRQNEILAHTDPATYQADLWGYADSLKEIASTLGRPLTDAEATWLSTVGLNSGVTPDSATMRQHLRGLIDLRQVAEGQGTAGAAKNELEGLIRGQWFAPIADPAWLARTAVDIATGNTTLESINAQLASQAWNMYPHMRDQITQGQTLADIMNPYRQIVADELEMGSVEQVDMNNPEWRRMMQWSDPNKDNTIRLPTASEVQVWARNRPQWWQTSKGREADAGSTRSLLQIFGGVK